MSRFSWRFLPSKEAWVGAARWTVRVVLLLFFLFALWGSLEVRKLVGRDERFDLGSWRLETKALPEWVTPEIRAELEGADIRAGIQALGLPPALSLFERGVLKKVKAALEVSPWVREVTDMRVRFPALDGPGVLELELELRRPVALLERAGHYHLVDAAGTRLGWPYREPPVEWFQVPVIAGLEAGPLPQPGARWTSRDILQGVEVARILLENNILRDFPSRLVHAIDLSNLHGRLRPRESEITLLSGGQKLAWGRSPLSAGARPVPVSEIVRNLRWVLSHPETYEKYTVIHLHRRQDDLTGIKG
jgi:hypothetical protein